MIPIHRGQRITVGAPIVQVKRIEGLPPFRDHRARTRYLRENASALFLRVSANVRVAPAVTDATGGVWAAAYDGDALDELITAAKGRGIRVWRIAPEPELMPGSIRNRRRFIGSEPLVWYPARQWRPSRRARAATLAFASVCLIASTTAAIVAPVIRQRAFVRDREPFIAAMRPPVVAAARARAELERVSKRLSDVAAFDNARAAMPALLGDLSAAMPESSAVVTLRVDATEGSATVLTSDVATLLDQIARVHGISAVRVSGALTSEMIAGARFQRVTVRFRRSAARK